MKTIMFPGQGSQRKGMGKELFPVYKTLTIRASEILGYDLVELCVNDPMAVLGQTQFTQPALYVVNTFRYFETAPKSAPDYLIGHSLGEYNALLAAGAFDFEVGLRLVKKRGELMADASGGAMAAVMGIDEVTLKQKLTEGGYQDIDVANFNTPTQTVIAGQQEAVNRVLKDFDAQGIRIVPLFVSAPFHSRYMQSAADKFAEFIAPFSFSSLQIPVIANATAQPYQDHLIKGLLSKQIRSAVRWVDTIRLLMGKEPMEFEEVGGEILTKMVAEIRQKSSPLVESKEHKAPSVPEQPPTQPMNETNERPSLARTLGSEDFRKEYRLRYAYITGSMYQGIASKEMVVRLGKAGMLGFLGTAGLSLEEIEDNIQYIQRALVNQEAYGLHWPYHPNDPTLERKLVGLYLRYRISTVEVSTFTSMPPALVYYWLMGLTKGTDGNVIARNKIVAKVSRPETAEIFMRPAPERIISRLLEEGLISPGQAALAQNIPLSRDICVETDTGWYTDAGNAFVLLPSIQQLRDRLQKQYQYSSLIRIGISGGMGTPQALACAFVMGADFVLTGSINQCTVEAGINDSIKDLLQEIDVQDTTYTVAEEMFEIGSKVQVLKKGVLFPVRANKLYALYNQYHSLEEIPERTNSQLENKYFNKPLSQIWEEVKEYWKHRGEADKIAKAEHNPHYKMALVFRWYLITSKRQTLEGNINNKENFQVHTGPALGAFNQWVKGTELANWRSRHVDAIGIKLMEETASLLTNRISSIHTITYKTNSSHESTNDRLSEKEFVGSPA